MTPHDGREPESADRDKAEPEQHVLSNRLVQLCRRLLIGEEDPAIGRRLVDETPAWIDQETQFLTAWDAVQIIDPQRFRGAIRS